MFDGKCEGFDLGLDEELRELGRELCPVCGGDCEEQVAPDDDLYLEHGIESGQCHRCKGEGSLELAS